MNGQFDSLIFRAASNPPSGLSSNDFFALIKAVITTESTWNPSAISYVGARGLMQVMPANATALGYHPDQLFDPQININLGTQILRDVINRFGLKDGLAAYNAGPGKRFISAAQLYADKVLNRYNRQRYSEITPEELLLSTVGPIGPGTGFSLLMPKPEPYQTLSPKGPSPYQVFAPQQFQTQSQPQQIEENIYLPLVVLGLLFLVAIQ